MKIRLLPQQIQKQILAPSMQQSIEVLMLPITDLNMVIDQELQNNPLLEVSEEKLGEKSEEKDSDELPDHYITDEIIRKLEKITYTPDYAYHGQVTDDELPDGKSIKYEESLEDRLLRELKVILSHPEEIKIGEVIIGNLDENGYLTVSCEEIIKTLGCPHMNLVEKVLHTIQNFEPVGIAARNLSECLKIQAIHKLTGAKTLPLTIIDLYLDELGHKKYKHIASQLNTSVDEVKAAAKLIATLDPKPARNYRPIHNSIYIRPDIFIHKNNSGGFEVQTSREGAPTLRINPFYKSMLSKNNLSRTERDFIKDKITDALNFMRSIEQRGQTIKTIANYILTKQINFFENEGSELVPMSLKDVAESLGRNESTISRAINNKYMDTPKGLFPLKFFFSQAVGSLNYSKNDSEKSNRSIKEEVKQIIEDENKADPLSDQSIVTIFAKKGTKIARRTITKYRTTLQILPTHLRKT